MTQYQGLTTEMYQAIAAVVDDRMREIRVTRQEFDRLVEAQVRTEAALNRLAEAQARAEEASEARFARIEAALNRLAEAQARTEEELRQYREASEARFARIEAALNRLAEAQARTEEELRQYREASEARFARIEAALERLAEAQARAEEELRRHREALGRLTEAQARTEEELRQYREASEARFARIEAALERMTAQIQGLTNRTGALQGRVLELTYQQKAGSYFGRLLQRPRALLPVEIEDQLEGRLSSEEFQDLLGVDLLVSGRPRHPAQAPPIWLVVEISATVDRHDVERARRRANLLRRAGLRAIPTVAGEDATMGAREEAEKHKVLLLQDGRALFWEEALAEALSGE